MTLQQREDAKSSLDLGKHGGAYPINKLPLHLRKLGSTIVLHTCTSK